MLCDSMPRRQNVVSHRGHRSLLSLWQLVLLVALAPACGGWQEQTLPAPQVVAEKQPSRIRVTRLDSSHVVLSKPAVTGDSLVGDQDGTPRAVPLSEVASVALPSGGFTGGLAIVLLLLTAGTVALVAGSCCGS